ncbi:MAG TPA: TPM domain-containing protein [Usitatibacter sp.]|nr:TPM domain-containing protein [Usitatibacter sp.]
MDWKRFWRHVAMTPATARRAFPDATMDAIARAIAEGERRHRGEVCFVVEAELSTTQLWRGLAARERAREVFASQGVWNTEENNGVLVYVLLADHDVEIVADRGIGARVDAAEWRSVVGAMEAHFRGGAYEAGAVTGVNGVNEILARHFPDARAGANQIPDRPIMM